MAHIVINREDGGESETYLVDTAEQIETARAALQGAGLVEADVWVGGDADSYRNGQKIFT